MTKVLKPKRSHCIKAGLLSTFFLLPRCWWNLIHDTEDAGGTAIIVWGWLNSINVSGSRCYQIVMHSSSSSAILLACYYYSSRVTTSPSKDSSVVLRSSTDRMLTFVRLAGKPSVDDWCPSLVIWRYLPILLDGTSIESKEIDPSEAWYWVLVFGYSPKLQRLIKAVSSP